jgi:L-cysteine S-thiosulfotransferase
MKRALALLAATCAMAMAQDARKSGAEYMGESTRAMQRDDTQNPAMLWVGDGEAMWKEKGCVSCHGDAKSSMRGVAARYPALDSGSKAILNLGQRINQCLTVRQHAAPMKAESRELLSIETYVALQSRGMPVSPPDDKRLAAATERGRQLFGQRMGQLNLSCAQCHDDNAGKRLAGALIPQGHANAYPIYRLEWQDMGSLQRRLRNCMSGVRAEVPPYDAQELVELELYLAVRAKGMPMEAPGVRP